MVLLPAQRREAKRNVVGVAAAAATLVLPACPTASAQL
jgi:hypothetical protein